MVNAREPSTVSLPDNSTTESIFAKAAAPWAASLLFIGAVLFIALHTLFSTAYAP